MNGIGPAHPHADFLPPVAQTPGRKPRGWLRMLWMLPLLALAGAAVGALAAFLGHGAIEALAARLPPLSVPVALACLVLTFWPNVVLHEAGHALAGLSRGMRAIGFGLGPLRWDRGADRWHFRCAGALAGISGFAALLPHGSRGTSRLDQAFFLAGGPLANLATAALLWSALSLASGSRAWAGVLVGTGLGALLLGLANLLPFHTRGWRSDGRGLLDLLRDTPDAALQQRVHQLMALTMAGVRPRDWPETLVPQAVSGSKSPMLAATGDILRLSWAMDRGDSEQAAGAARRATAAYNDVPEAFRPHLAVALAGHVALMLHDHALLATWRPLCEGGVTDLSVYRAWLDAELAAHTGDDAAARAAIAHARTAVARASDPVTALQIGEYLDAFEARPLPSATQRDCQGRLTGSPLAL
jgi:hypothetical protein